MALNKFNFLVGLLQDFFLVIRNFNVVDTDRNSSFCGILKPQVHQLIREHHGFLQSNVTVAFIHDFRNRALVENTVDQCEGHSVRQNFRKQRSADGGVIETSRLSLFAIDDLAVNDAYSNSRMQ